MGAGVGDTPAMVSLVLLGGFGAVIQSTRFLEKGVYQVYRTPARLVRADLDQILVMGHPRGELVILRLGHPLQERLQMLPRRMRSQGLQPLGLLPGEVVGQQVGR